MPYGEPEISNELDESRINTSYLPIEAYAENVRHESDHSLTDTNPDLAFAQLFRKTCIQQTPL